MRIPKPSHRFLKSPITLTLSFLLATVVFGGSKTLGANDDKKNPPGDLATWSSKWSSAINSACILASDGYPTCEYRVINMPAGLLVSNIKSAILLNEYSDKQDIWVKPDGMSNSVLYHFTKKDTMDRVELAIKQYDVSPDSHRILVEVWIAVVTATKDSDFSLNITGLLNNLLSGSKISIAPGPAAMTLGLSFSDQTFNNIRAFYKRAFSIQEAIHSGLSDDNQGYQGVYQVQNVTQTGSIPSPTYKFEGLYKFFYDKALFNKESNTIRVSNFNLGFGLPVKDFANLPNVENLEIKNEMVTFYNGIPTNISRKGFTRDQSGSSIGLQMGRDSNMVDGEIHVWARFTAFPHTKDFASLPLETINHPPTLLEKNVTERSPLAMSEVLSRLTLTGIQSTDRMLWQTNYLFLPAEVARVQNINSLISFKFKRGDGSKLLEKDSAPTTRTVLEMINEGLKLPINKKAKEKGLAYFSVEAMPQEDRSARKEICFAFDPVYNRKVSSKTLEDGEDCSKSTFEDELPVKNQLSNHSNNNSTRGSWNTDKTDNDAGI